MRYCLISFLLLYMFSCSGGDIPQDDNSPAGKDSTVVTEKRVLNNPDTDVKGADGLLPVLSDSSDFGKLTAHIDKLDSLRSDTVLSDSINSLLWKLCPLYYDLREQDRNKRTIRFYQIYDSLKPGNGPNDKFLADVINLRFDSEKRAFEMPVAPVFQGLTSGISVFEPDVQTGADKTFFNDIRDDEDMLVSDLSNFENQYHYPLKYEAGQRDSVYIISRNTSFRVAVSSFNYKTGDCLSYYYYQTEIPDKFKQEARDAVLASTYDLDLVFEPNTNADQALQDLNPPVCLDCPVSRHFQKTFASLRGYPGFYFTYTQEPDKEVDDTYVPVRSLIYYKDGFLHTIWTKSIDTFGCSCL